MPHMKVCQNLIGSRVKIENDILSFTGTIIGITFCNHYRKWDFLIQNDKNILQHFTLDKNITFTIEWQKGNNDGKINTQS